MTNTMRRIHAIRTGINVGAAVLMLIITTTVAAQVAGMPDPVLFGGGEDGMGILTVVSILGITAVIFGAPAVLAANIFHWAAAHWFRRREHGRATPPADPGSRQGPEGNPEPPASDE